MALSDVISVDPSHHQHSFVVPNGVFGMRILEPTVHHIAPVDVRGRDTIVEKVTHPSPEGTTVFQVIVDADHADD